MLIFSGRKGDRMIMITEIGQIGGTQNAVFGNNYINLKNW